MRKIRRLALDAPTRRALRQKQSTVDERQSAGTFDRIAYWKGARKTKPLRTVLSTLNIMAGSRQRCMYCLDSHGADIEHFWPQAAFPGKMFLWENHLLCCTECGRIKGDRFPIVNGKPLLLDPTVDEPWDHIDFDPDTGKLVARFDVSTDDYSVRGVVTVQTLKLDRREALEAGYLKTIRQLADTVNRFMIADSPSSSAFVADLIHIDDHGLLGWCIIGDGWKTPPFTTLRQNYPEVWESLERSVRWI